MFDQTHSTHTLLRPFLAWVALSLLVSPAWSAELADIRIGAAGEATRVVLDLSERVDYQLFPLRAPARLVIDIPGMALAADFDATSAAGGVVRGVRTGTHEGALRVVLDLDEDARPTTSFAGPKGQAGERLVIDLASPTIKESRRQVARSATIRPVTIAIDPGHGGIDPGALGRGKTREKDVVLAIGRKLRDQINREPGMRAIMIRDSDHKVPHRQRMQMARSANADLFISIHADAFHDVRARGSSVYALSMTGASNEAAAWLAASQNAEALVGGVELGDKDPTLASILLDLSQNATIGASIKVGGHVLAQLKTVGRVHKPKVQHANFAVLHSPDVPSILVETAFISNPEEERKLKSNDHQEKLAAAIATGVRDYFRANPLPQTYFANLEPVAEKRAATQHVITRGDTLSEIAERYNVGLSRLRKANELNTDSVRIGQVLTIPAGG